MRSGDASRDLLGDDRFTERRSHRGAVDSARFSATGAIMLETPRSSNVLPGNADYFIWSFNWTLSPGTVSGCNRFVVRVRVLNPRDANVNE
jgi:hypothetical protein